MKTETINTFIIWTISLLVNWRLFLVVSLIYLAHIYDQSTKGEKGFKQFFK